MDKLVVTLDNSKTDCPVLVVGRNGFIGDYTIIATFVKDEAVEIYNKLIGNIKAEVSE